MKSDLRHKIDNNDTYISMSSHTANVNNSEHRCMPLFLSDKATPKNKPANKKPTLIITANNEYGNHNAVTCVRPCWPFCCRVDLGEDNDFNPRSFNGSTLLTITMS